MKYKYKINQKKMRKLVVDQGKTVIANDAVLGMVVITNELELNSFLETAKEKKIYAVYIRGQE